MIPTLRSKNLPLLATAENTPLCNPKKNTTLFTKNILLTFGLMILFALVGNQSFAQANLYWDANGATAGTGGTGTWNTAGTWRSGSATGTLGNWVDGSNAIFEGTAGTVTIPTTTTITTNNITFSTTGYIVTGATSSGKLSLSTTNKTITISSGVVAKIGTYVASSLGSAVLSGTGGMTIDGSGELILAAGLQSSLSGGVTVTGNSILTCGDRNNSTPVLNGANSSAGFFGGNALVLNNGTLRLAATNATGYALSGLNGISVSASSTGTFDIWRTATAASTSPNLTTNSTATVAMGSNSTLAVVIGGGTANAGNITFGNLTATGNFSLKGPQAGFPGLRFGTMNDGGFQMTLLGGGTSSLAGINPINSYTTAGSSFTGSLVLGNSGGTEGASYSASAVGSTIITTGNITVNSNSLLTLANTGSFGNAASVLTLNGNGLANTGGSLISSTAGTTNWLGTTVLGADATVAPANTLSLNLAVSGGFKLTMAGAGVLTLPVANSHTGGTTLTSGTLNINHANALGTIAGTFTISGGTIDNTSGSPITTLNYPMSWGGNFAFTGTSNLNLGTGAVTLATANRQVTVSGGVLAIGGNTSGAFRLTKAGAGTLTLSGTNGHTGGTTLSAGTLNINNSNALGTIAGTFTISGGIIDNTSGSPITTLNYPMTWGGDFTFTGTSNLNLGTGAVTLATANRQVTVSGGVLAIGGNTSGAFQLTKAGAGTLTLSGTNGHTGGTTLSAGTLNINNSNALGTVAGTFTISGGTIDNTSGSAITTLNYPMSWNGNFAFTGTNDLNLGTEGIALSANRQVTVNASTLTVGGIISGAFKLTKTGSGILALTNGSNSYSGGTQIDGGTVTVDGPSRIGATSGDLTINNGTFQSTAAVGISSARNFIIGHANSIIDITTSSYSSASGSVFSGSGRINKNGAGTLNFSSTNASNHTYSGGLTISAGAVTINKETDLGAVPGAATANNVLINGGSLQVGMSVSTIANRGFGIGASNATINVLTSQTFTINGIMADNSGSGNLIKLGAGILSLTNSSNAFTGTTTITAGELNLNPSANATFASQVVLNGGTLSSTDIISTRTFTSSSTLNLNANSTIALGSNSHTITFANSSAVTWAGSTLTITGWTGSAGATGTSGQIFIGAEGLTSTQLSKINFNGYASGAMIVSGELVPFAISSPTISTNGSLSAVNTTYGTASASPTSFTVSGASMSEGITVTPPAGYEVSQTSSSTDYAGNGTAITITGTGTIASKTIYVRLAANASVDGSPYTGNITCSSFDATDKTVATVSSTVSAKALTISGLTTGVNKVYDGVTTAEIGGTAIYSGQVNGEDLPVVGIINFDFINKNVGTGKTIIVTGYEAPSTNYSITQPTGFTANITTAPLTIYGLLGDSKNYDGNTTASFTGTATYDGLQNGETFAVTGSPSASFETASVGNLKPITVIGYTAPSANYSITQPSLTGDIFAVAPGAPTIGSAVPGNEQATVTFTAPAFNGGTSITGYTVTSNPDNFITTGSGSPITITGLFNGTPYTFTVTANNAAGDSVASAASNSVTPSSITVPEINSTLTASATYGVAATTYTITGTNTPTSFSATGLPAGLSLTTSTGDITGTPTAAPGNYDVTISATNDGGTGLPATLVYTIGAKTLTLPDAVATTKEYNRTNAAIVTGTLTGIVGSDDVTFNGTGTFSQTGIGTGLAVTSTASLGGAKAAYYTLTQPTGLTADITPKGLTVTGASVTSKTYTGTNPATITGATLVGVISPDVVTVSGGGTFTDVNVANGISVTAALSLGGATAGNYSLTQPTLTGNITTATLTITGVSGVNRAYDGGTSATVTGTPAYNGLASGDVFETVTGSPTFSFGDATAANGKSIIIGGGGYTAPSANYTVTQPTVSANITKVALTITAADQSVAYATAVATVTGAGTYTPTGFVNSENASVIGGSATYSTSYTITTEVGTTGVTITPIVSSLTSTNYSFTAATGTITVGKANQSITALTTPITKILSDATYSVATTATSGLTVNYSSNNASVATVASNGTVTIQGVGTAIITASQAGNSNYNPATSVTQALTVNPNPSITATPASLAAFTTTAGTASTAQAFTVTGSNLLSVITLTPPSGYQVCLTSDGTYAATVTTPQTGTATIVYVRIASSATAGSYSGNVALTSSSASTINVAVSGTVNAVATSSLIAGWDFQTITNGGTAVAVAPNTPTSFVANFGSGTLYANNTNGSSSWVTATSGNEITSFGGTTDNTSGTSFSTVTSGSSSLAFVSGTSNLASGKSVVFKFSMTNKKDLVVSYSTQRTSTGFTTHQWDYSTDGSTWTSGAESQTITSIATNFATKTLTTITSLDGAANAYLRLTFTGTTGGNNRIDNVQLNATPNSSPVIIAGGGPLSSLSTTYGTPSSPTSFELTGSNLSSTISIAALSGFEFSATAGGAGTYTSTLSGISATGPTTIYVRLAASANAGTYSGNIVCSSGSTTLNVPMASSIISKVTPTLSISNSTITYTGTEVAATVTGSVAGTVSSVKYDGSDTVPSTAGTYAITADFTPTDGINYNSLTAASAGNFVISKATPTLSISNSPQTYTGSAIASTVTGSVAGTISNVKYGGSATVPTNAGTYAVTANLVPTDGTNYNSLTDVSAGNFVIDKATLTITAGNQSVCYGTAAATVTGAGTYLDTGYVNGETSSVLSGSVTYTTTYTSSTAAGTSSITITPVMSGLSATNYQFSAVTGTITVNPTLTPSVSISSDDADNIICLGAPVTFTAVPTNGGSSPSYQWKLNGSNVGTDSTTYTSSALANNDQVTVVMTSNATPCLSGSPATSNAITITIANNTWLGVSSVWNSNANWSCGFPPSTLENATIAQTSFNPTITADVSIQSLTIASGASVTVTSGYNLTVADAVINNGGTFTIQNNANLIQTNNVANTGNAIINRNSASIQLYDYTLWSSPVASQQLQAFSPSTLAFRFYTYNSSSNTYSVVASPSSTNFADGTGYLIRAPYDWPTTATPFEGQFTGVPNNGTKNLTGLTAGNFYAVGNPYPSTISANSFISGNSTGGTLYFWRKTNNVNAATTPTPSYATYTYAGGTATAAANTGGSSSIIPNGTIQVGQGFIVKATAASLTFNNTMRTANVANQFLKTTEEKSRFWLNLTSATGYFCQTLVAYMPEATTGVDNAIDGPYFNDSPTALTSIIDQSEFTIQGKPLPFDTNDTVPLGFKTNAAGNFTIGIDHVDGLFSNGQTIFLKDNLANTSVNLSAGAYTFASEVGIFNSRFEIVYQSALVLPTFTANNVVVYSQNGEVTINSGTTEMDQVRIFDVRGRLLAERSGVHATEIKLNIGVQNQVLLVKITAENGSVVTKKIIQ
jgi:autotransporter-associated beta strand protein